MPDELLRFQPAQDGPDGRVGQRALFPHGQTNLFTGCRPVLPKKVHNLLFENPKVLLSNHVLSP
jgi:hypothetical protein